MTDLAYPHEGIEYRMARSASLEAGAIRPACPGRFARRAFAQRIGRTFAAAAFALASLVAAAAPRAGDPAPDFVGYDPDGQRLSFARYAGKVVVLSFWATWCGPCRKELPLLEGIARTAGAERVQVLAINIESTEIYRKVAQTRGSLQMLLAHDPDETARRAFGVNGIPHMVIIGKDGRIVRVHRGYTEAGVDLAVADLNRALAE